jgi:beta-alanine--pyruvate transaminase
MLATAKPATTAGQGARMTESPQHVDQGARDAGDAAGMTAYWMPFTSNRRFKRDPVLFSAAQGMYYFTPSGERILDAMAGLWCVNAGHGRPAIVEAIARQAAQLDYAPSFQYGHPLAFELAARLTAMAPAGIEHAFFVNSGSEAVDTALKIALAYHHARGSAGRTRLIGRDRGYHGVGFGGISVGGIAGHRRPFGNLLASVDHLRHTYERERTAFTRGLPQWGAELAEDLVRLVQLHDASTIAAVIVEPVAGSTGVLLPPPGYLRRLREICDQYGILLIFDEVITAFGRLGRAFAADYFGVVPDMITCAKGMTNGTVPMGAVLVRDSVHDALMRGPLASIELPHGYTYSGHPLACAAGLATLDVYADEGLFQRADTIAPHFEQALHSLKGSPHVVDIRCIGLMAAVDFAAVPGAPGRRSYACHRGCLEHGVAVRMAGDSIVLSPPLIIEKGQIDEIVSAISQSLQRVE